MDEVVIDKAQIIGEVKERNKLYKALVRVQEIANNPVEDNSRSLNEIAKICEEALKNII